jgi:hypothetical protein
MKLLCVTERYGDRIFVRPVGWGNGVYFAGRQPQYQVVLLLHFPGLNMADTESIIKWLGQRSGLLAKLLPSRRQVSELPEDVWRPAVLDDVLEAHNYSSILWQLQRHFSLEQFNAFATRYLPEAQQRIRDLLAISDPTARSRKLEEVRPWLERVAGVFAQIPGRLHIEREKIWEQLDQLRIAAVRATPFHVQTWAEAADQLYTTTMKMALLSEIAQYIAQAGGGTAAILQALQPISASYALKRFTQDAAWFWGKFTYALRLEPNVSGETIDISRAQEQTAQLSWELIEGRRVGTIVPGRTALVLNDDGVKTFIAGERRLKFQVSRAGGRLEKFGNTLITSDDGASAMHKALLDVDLLDTLANLDPSQALERIHHLRLPPDHPVFRAATAAKDDIRQARVLADLLIELVVGVDADIARRLARAQARANRR